MYDYLYKPTSGSTCLTCGWNKSGLNAIKNSVSLSEPTASVAFFIISLDDSSSINYLF